MGKKKFIDKKKSATFHILARDSNDPTYDQGPNGDRVFVRVDNNPFPVTDFGEDVGDGDSSALDAPYHPDHDPDSIFADAPEDDEDGHHYQPHPNPAVQSQSGRPTLPDNIRREILELGFPDDGYNYLFHLREIKNNGGGSSYYENSKAKLDQVSRDVKAYDATRVKLSGVREEFNDNSIYGVAAKTVGVRVEKAVDPEVAALLEDDDMSRFGSDVEDLEEDFVVQANLLEEGEEEENVEITDKRVPVNENEVNVGNHTVLDNHLDAESGIVEDKPRSRRLLDEQFDMLTLQEYGTESESDFEGTIEADDECLANKLNNVLMDHVKDDIELDEKYRVPADIVHENKESKDGEVVRSAAEVIRRCAEYAEGYDNENQDNDEVVILEESSDEGEVWDCETIVSTYSNLDNHPAKIETPGVARKKKLAETVSAVPGAGNHLISLRGKEKLPIDYLPHSKKAVSDKVIKTPGSISNQLKRKPHGGESKEEKKERKSAVKEERREARLAKKEMKGIYRSEAQRAQKVAAISGPPAIHLM